MSPLKNVVVPDEVVPNKIYLIRNQKVMLDRDLAELYDVKPIRLREQVKRNKDRFPENFMFQLTEEEVNNMVSQNAIPSKKALGGAFPCVFTEHGGPNVIQCPEERKSNADEHSHHRNLKMLHCW
jgi:hypothetical protein